MNKLLYVGVSVFADSLFIVVPIVAILYLFHDLLCSVSCPFIVLRELAVYIVCLPTAL